jgi:hypothetical protein
MGAVLLAEEERRLLAKAMGELPDETREVVALFYSEGRFIELRQSTPFAGALRPQERWRIWRETRELFSANP